MTAFISASCLGEKCWCTRQAEHKVEEVIFSDDPLCRRPPLTTYLCKFHFREIMGPAAGAYKIPTLPSKSPLDTLDLRQWCVDQALQWPRLDSGEEVDVLGKASKILSWVLKSSQ